MKVVQEGDRLDPRLVLLVGATAVLLTVVAVIVAWLLLGWNLAAVHTKGRHSARSRHVTEEVSAMERSLFSKRVETMRQLSEPARLRQYGYVDRASGTVHIPIRRAMHLYVRQQASMAPETPNPGSDPQRAEPTPSTDPSHAPRKQEP